MRLRAAAYRTLQLLRRSDARRYYVWNRYTGGQLGAFVCSRIRHVTVHAAGVRSTVLDLAERLWNERGAVVAGAAAATSPAGITVAAAAAPAGTSAPAAATSL